MRHFLFRLAVESEKLTRREVREAMRLLYKDKLNSKDQLRDNQNKAFRALIQFVNDHNPYYRFLFKENGVNPESILGIDDITKLPLLTKDIIKANRQNIVTPSIPASECITRTSGGTTGEPIYVEINKQARINELYAYFRGLAWMGWVPGDSMVKFFGGSIGGGNSPTFKNKIKKWVSGELFIPAFELNSKTAPIILASIRARGRTFMQGYVSSLYTLALFAKQLNFKGLNIKGVFTTAEQLPLEQAQFIQEVFKCDVKAFYGCAEMNSIGFQSQMSGPYIVPGEIVHIESIKHPYLDLDNCILLTSLYNYKTPLIRYLNGDNGLIGDGHEVYRTIDELSGRTADMFIRKDGSYISSIVATQTMQLSGLTNKIKRYQLVQLNDFQVEFRYEEFGDNVLHYEELNKVVQMYQNRLGNEFIIQPVKTNEFLKSFSGKHRLMINKYSNKL